MFVETHSHFLGQILCCDPEPDSRNKTTEKLIGFGYDVLATGNPKIASAMAQEKPFSALVVAVQEINLGLLSVMVEARRHNPRLPILVLLSDSVQGNIPAGLADVVLVNPNDRAVGESLRALTECQQLASLAS